MLIRVWLDWSSCVLLVGVKLVGATTVKISADDL